MKRVDARGLSCPEPVIQTKNAMASKEAEYEVLVDNVVAERKCFSICDASGISGECGRTGRRFPA